MTTAPSWKVRLEELQARRAALDEDIRVEEAAVKNVEDLRRNAVKRKWKFTFLPSTNRNESSWLRIRDEAVRTYSLSGWVMNKEELTAAGHLISDDRDECGSMLYLFNTCNGKIIKAEGGGRTFINERPTSNVEEVRKACAEDSERVYSALEALLKSNPEGGDVTDIILTQRYPSWRV